MGNEKFLINGFDGRKKLTGRIPVMGAKNAALKVLASSILFDGDIRVTNVPLIQDVFKMKSMLEDLGANVERTAERSFSIKLPAALNTDLNEETARSFRSSIVLIGPILAKEGRVSFPHPGGCVIGERPIDIFLEGFEKMGAKISQKGKKYVISAPRLKSAEIIFRVPSVTATETFMMAAVLTPGLTVLHNVACEPEIESLADFLNSGGAKIRGAGTHTIKVEGVKSLRASGPFETPPDRIEAGSFIILAGLCGKDIEVVDCRPGELKVLLRLLSLIGFNIEESENAVRIKKSSKLRAADIKTREYPGIPTDLQPLLAVLMTQANGRSLLFETVFEGRLNYVGDLVRMGANIVVCDPHRAIINGPNRLRGREVESPDLRAGLAFVLAALAAEGASVIHNIHYIDRGYENLEERLKSVGADIVRT